MQTKEQLIRDMFRLIDARSFTELDSTMALDIVSERPGHPPRSSLGSASHFYLCERQVAHGSFSGATKTGLAIETRFSELYQIRNELPVFRRSYFFEPINIGPTSDNGRYL